MFPDLQIFLLQIHHLHKYFLWYHNHQFHELIRFLLNTVIPLVMLHYAMYIHFFQLEPLKSTKIYNLSHEIRKIRNSTDFFYLKINLLVDDLQLIKIFLLNQEHVWLVYPHNVRELTKMQGLHLLITTNLIVLMNNLVDAPKMSVKKELVDALFFRWEYIQNLPYYEQFLWVY